MIGLTWFAFFHMGALILYNRSRRATLLKYVALATGRELTERQGVDLVDRYTAFFAHIEPYPDRQQYAGLYTNEAFAAWCRRSKRLMRYLLGGTGFGWASLMVMSFFD